MGFLPPPPGKGQNPPIQSVPNPGIQPVPQQVSQGLINLTTDVTPSAAQNPAEVTGWTTFQSGG